MDAEITLRDGVTKTHGRLIRECAPMVDTGGQWMDRVSAAVSLSVGVRTVDRYIRQRKLTAYRGPVPEGGVGVRIWAADVVDFPASVTVKVVP